MFGNSADESGMGFYTGANETIQPAKGEPKRAQSVVPLCVAQLLNCSGEDFMMFGFKPAIINIVCVLRDIDVSSTKATYKVSDHTGTIQAILWLENDNSGSVNLPPVKEGRYVRMYGNMRITDGVKTFLVLRMLPVEDINEITTHLLEVIHARYAIEKMSKDSGSLSRIAQNNPNADLANSMNSVYHQTVNNEGFTPMQKKVYEAVFQGPGDNGYSRAEIIKNFPANQHKDVNNALEYLTSEGHVYTTLDDDHFKVTD